MNTTIGNDGIGNGDEPTLVTGACVDVWNRSFQDWSHNFQIDSSDELGGFRVRRLSDGSVLPIVFQPDELRIPGTD